jgi:hypothetical protein
MPNQNLSAKRSDGQALVETRPINRSKWLDSFLMGAAIAILISLITIVFFEWYFFTVVDGLAMSQLPITETLRRIDGSPQTRPPFQAPLNEHHHQTGIESLSVSVSPATDSKPV